MPLSTRDFAQLTDELQDIYAEHSESAIANATGLQVFDVGQTELKNFEHQILHNIAGIEKVGEGANLPRINGDEGKVIALIKFLLITGKTLTVSLKATRGKLTEMLLQPQRLSEETA